MKYKSLIFLLFVLLLTNSGCKIQEVGITDLHGIRINRLSAKQIGVDVLVQINNPNNFGFRITRIDLDVSLNGKYLGKISQAGKTFIPECSDDVHSFQLTVEMESWISGLTSFINMLGKRTASLEMEGSFRVRSSVAGKTIRVKEKAEVSVL